MKVEGDNGWVTVIQNASQSGMRDYLIERSQPRAAPVTVLGTLTHFPYN